MHSVLKENKDKRLNTFSTVSPSLALIMCRLISISPAIATVWIAANKKQCHTFLPSSSCLEEDSFSMIALCATNGFSTRKCWIGSNILQDLSALPNRVMYLISIDTVVLSNLLVIAVSAGIEKDLLLPIFLWVENVVAFSAKLHSTHFDDAEKIAAKRKMGWTLGFGFAHSFLRWRVFCIPPSPRLLFSLRCSFSSAPSPMLRTRGSF